MSRKIFTLKMNQVFNRAAEIMRKIGTGTTWICKNHHTSCMFHFLQESGCTGNSARLDPHTLFLLVKQNTKAISCVTWQVCLEVHMRNQTLVNRQIIDIGCEIILLFLSPKNFQIRISWCVWRPKFYYSLLHNSFCGNASKDARFTNKLLYGWVWSTIDHWHQRVTTMQATTLKTLNPKPKISITSV